MPQIGRGPNSGNNEKAKDFKTSIKKLLAFCKPFFPIIIISTILAIIGAILSVIGPNILSDLTNEITSGMMTGIDLSAVTSIALTLVLIYAFSLIFNIIQGILMANTSQKISKNLRGNINNKLKRLPLSYIDSNPYGNIMSKATNDVDTIGQGINNNIASLLGSITLFVACLIMMFITNWIMALTAIGSSIVGFILIMLIMRKSQKHFVEQQNNLGELNGKVEENFASQDIIKIYNATESKNKDFAQTNNKLYNSVWKSQFLSGMMPNLMSFIGNFGYVSVCVIGAILVANGNISIGTIVLRLCFMLDCLQIHLHKLLKHLEIYKAQLLPVKEYLLF